MFLVFELKLAMPCIIGLSGYYIRHTKYFQSHFYLKSYYFFSEMVKLSCILLQIVGLLSFRVWPTDPNAEN